MIITRISGGIGNQLFQYATAYTLAKQRNTDLLLDIRWYQEKTDRHFVLDKFQTVNNIISNEKLMTYCHNRWHKILYRLGLGKHHPIIKDPKWKVVDFSGIGSNTYLFGYWMSTQYFYEELPELKTQLQLKITYLNPAFGKLEQILQTGIYTAIHIRRGDYLHEFNQSFFNILPLSYYQIAIKYILEKVPETKFIIFSDDPIWVKEQTIFPYNSLFASDFDLNTDYLEFIAMQSCNNYIIANSTFSWWAAFLGKNESDKIIIQPRIWFGNIPAQRAYENGEILYQKGSIKL